jgi:hypothetical protein
MKEKERALWDEAYPQSRGKNGEGRKEELVWVGRVSGTTELSFIWPSMCLVSVRNPQFFSLVFHHLAFYLQPSIYSSIGGNK